MLMVAAALACPSPAGAAERFPPPEIERSDYAQPTILQTPPRSNMLEYLDVGVLVVCLAAASYLALKLRSRRGLVIVMLFSLGYFGFYRQGCVCSIGAIQNASLGIFGNDTRIHVDAARARQLGADFDKVTLAVHKHADSFLVLDFAASEAGLDMLVKGNESSWAAIETLKAMRVTLSQPSPAATATAPVTRPAPTHLTTQPATQTTDTQATQTHSPHTQSTPTEPDQTQPTGEVTATPPAARAGNERTFALGEIVTVSRDYHVPMTAVLFLALPLVATLLFGRTFCAAVCPLGAAQDVLVLKPVAVPSWLEHSLGLLPFVYLSVAVVLAATGGAFLICQYDPIVGFFRLNGPWQMLTLGALLLLIGVFVARPYCRYLCPLGAVFRLLSPMSWKHATITPDECIKCRLCEDVCPVGAIRRPAQMPPERQRLAGKMSLAITLILLPLLVAGGAIGGRALHPALAHSNPTWRLARQIDAENNGTAAGRTEASDVFRKSGRPVEPLMAEAAAIKDRVILGGSIAGGLVGLVIGLKLVGVSVRRRRDDYDINEAMCVSCGRCFMHCPRERLRRKKLKEAKP